MTTLIRVDNNGTTEWRQPDWSEPEAEEETPRPTSRVVRFEVPDGFMATISLVPYTETPAEPPFDADLASGGSSLAPGDPRISPVVRRDPA